MRITFLQKSLFRTFLYIKSSQQLLVVVLKVNYHKDDELIFKPIV